MVAANPQAPGGVVGVVPNAKILPVQVFGLGGEISGDALVESIGYAAARGADIINLSLGSLLPTQAEADQIFAVILRRFPVCCQWGRVIWRVSDRSTVILADGWM